MEFVPRTAAFRGRGRPPVPVPPRILEALQQTLVTGTAATINVATDTPENIAELRRQLRRAARQNGWRIRTEGPDRTGKFVFAAEVRQPDE